MINFETICFNTIQYNTIQYNKFLPIYCIGGGEYCNILYCIEIYCFKVDHQSSSSPCSLSSLTEAFSLTTYATNEGFHSNCFLFRNSSASNVLGCKLQRDGQNTCLAMENLSTSFDVGSRKLVLMYTPLAFSLCRG